MMKKIIVSSISLVLMLVLVESVSGFSGPGSGTEIDPYIITDVNQLQEMQYALNAWYELGNNIDASETETWNSGAGFVPVGDTAHPFVGHLQGNGFVISGFYIYRINRDYVGLFGKVGSNGTVDSITLEDPNVTGNDYTGSLVGYTDTSLNYCDVSGGYVNGNDRTGALAGVINSSISLCNAAEAYVTGHNYTGGLVGKINDSMGNCNSLLVTVYGNDNVGGLAGHCTSVSNCASSGLVQANSNIGGLIGYANGSMANCSSTASVIGSGASCGGLIGDNRGGTVTNCYATGSVSGSDTVGGLFGYHRSGNISLCHSTGNVEGGAQAGGLIGYAYSSPSVSNCYSTGNVTSAAGQVGGLIGYLYSTNQLTDCYAAGTVSGSGDRVGGLIGYLYSGNISDCYASGNVYNSEGSNVGGVVGYFRYGTIERSYSAAEVVTGLSTVGGLVGYSEYPSALISQCYSITHANSVGDDAGGLVGYNNGTITNCYAHGSVIGADYIGGFAGENAASGDISKCYSTGSVTGVYNVGGFAGWNSGSCADNYWDVETSNRPTSPGAEGKTTEEMMQQATYEPEWNFEAVWGIDEPNYPVLTIFTPTCGDPWHPYPTGDFNRDCRVDFLDFASFVSHWLESTAPE